MHDERTLDRAVTGDLVLIDPEGEEWMLDSYDADGGFITRDGSDTYFVSHSQLAEFTFVSVDAFTTTWE